MPRADVHRCKCSGTRLLSAGWHSSTEKQSRQFTLNTAGVHWSLVAEHLYAKECRCLVADVHR